MLKTVGIVAEYNPFHTGHQYQLDYLAQKGYKSIAVALSGSCVQRGQLCLLSKFERAKLALTCGVSLVCEIPAPYSMLSAEGFARAGMSILKNLGVSAVSFGSECGDLALLTQLAQYLLSEEYASSLKLFLQDNIPFAAARQKAILQRFAINDSVLCASNDILAIEYIKECLRLDWRPDFILVKRRGALYNDPIPKGGFASAGYIRKCVADFRFDEAESFVPENIKPQFRKQLETANYFIPDQSFNRALFFNLCQKSADDFACLPDCNTELSFAFEKAVLRSSTIEQLMENLPTKQYTRSRLCRIMLFSLLGISHDYPSDVPYIRILAMNSLGEEIVKNAKGSQLPISHSYRTLSALSTECKAVIRTESL
ncbi:MAG: nucleotidyltransferase family protein, partial [Oscillospiraceae bacterium]